MVIVDVTTSTRPKVKQHQPGTGFKTLAMSSKSRSPGRTIEYCDSPYHIIFTNVKMNS